LKKVQQNRTFEKVPQNLGRTFEKVPQNLGRTFEKSAAKPIGCKTHWMQTF
jgi:hypothetical protein